MVVVHFGEHVDSIRVEREIRVVNYSERVQLMSKYTFTVNELCRVGSIQTIDTVRPTNAVL